ncbi:MAG TPA: hypothetical protein VL137_18710 [Polyangiaceae bacterium]|nr:hypothetical protein [Polyangiaceae bacterium]
MDRAALNNRAKSQRAAFTFLAALVIALGCDAPADKASASRFNTEPSLPTPARPAPNWNCGDRCYKDPSVPQAAARAFGGSVEGTDSRPEIIYPLDGSAHPINLSNIVFQFKRKSTAQKWFDIQIVAMAGSSQRKYDFLVPCDPPPHESVSDRCVYALPAEHWRSLAEENEGAQVNATVGTLSEDAEVIVRSLSVTLQFPRGAITGGFYYWSTALGGTYRLPFGATEAVPWIAPKSESNPSACGGCHAVSRNGNVIAFTSDAAAGYLQVADAADPAHKLIDSEGTRNSSMMALNSDGSRVVVAYDGRLTLTDTATDTVLAQADSSFFGGNQTAFFPEFAPHDDKLVVTLSDAPDSFWSVTTGQIAIIPLHDDQFGPAQVIVNTPNEVHFYPSWSPDEKWIVFASAPLFSVSYDQPSARLRVVHADGGDITELSNATQGIGNTSSLPKFAPFVQPDGSMFFTFNSKIDYGYLLENSARPDPSERLPQLWLSLFQPTRVGHGDPSSAPVWLPFQQVDQRNHLGLWTERVSCGNESQQVSVCGSGEICIDSTCHIIR